MKASLETRIISNFMLYIDNALQKYGSAYQNYSGRLYPVQSDIANRYAYSTPFKPLCNDTSIAGAQIMSGVYVNGTYTPLGSGGLTEINHYKGVVYFNTPLASSAVVSGNYAIKEFQVELADDTEWNLLFNRKYVNNNSLPQNISGLPIDAKVLPIVYVVVKGQENKPFAFRKIDESRVELRCVILTDNEWQCVGASSILKNTFENHMPMLTGLPFNQNGTTTGQMFNYDTNLRDSGFYPWIAQARAADILQKGDYKDIPRRMATVDFIISTIMVNS